MQKAWQAWTFVDFGQKSFGQDSRAGLVGVAMRRTALAWGLGQFGREAFCPWRPLEVIKPWQARTFAAAELAPSMAQYDPKVILGARPLDPRGDSYYGS